MVAKATKNTKTACAVYGFLGYQINIIDKPYDGCPCQDQRTNKCLMIEICLARLINENKSQIPYDGQ